MYYILRKHIKIKVLLTPGTTIPIDIRKPEKIKDPKERSFRTKAFPRLILFSKTTKKYPKTKVITANIK